MTKPRLERLHASIRSDNLDAIVLNPGPTLTYLSGLHFHLMERPTILIIKPGVKPVLILPELEAGKVSSSTISLDILTFNDDPSTWNDVFKTASRKLELEGLTIGVEPNRLRYLELSFLQRTINNANFRSAEKVLESLRECKEANEIDAMKEAVRIAQDALTATLPFIKPGGTEHQVAAELTIQMLRVGGAPEMPFSPIVASGPNSANPHAVPSDRKLQVGDLVVIDWGAGYADYCSDLTRTFAIGSISDELRKIYETVKQANATGKKVGKPGIEAGEIDRAARKVIDDAGYGEYFTHRTGHGLGMEGHETPYMFGANKQILKTGMVYTVEPGIYLPGIGGVRIEDDIVVTPDGAESLSDYPRELTIL